MRLIPIAIGIVIAFVCLVLWLRTQIHYRIGSRHLKILCGGLTLRRIELTGIKRISKREPKGLAEYWTSTFKLSHRMLTIERSSGLRRYIVITPRNRYVFLADLQNAIKRVAPEADVATIVERGETDGGAET